MKLFSQTIYSITHRIAGNDLAADTKMLLTTAIYFKGKWEKSFDIKSTRMLCFNALTGCVKTNMMENIDNYKYAYIPALDAEVAEIPYTVGHFFLLLRLFYFDNIHFIKSRC